MSLYTNPLFIIITLTIIALPCSHPKIVDFSHDNIFFPPYVTKFHNSRNQDYLIKLLKRNLEAKRKLNDANARIHNGYHRQEGQRCPECAVICNCGGGHRHNYNRKRCQKSDDTGEEQPAEVMMCEGEGVFSNPANCQQFYICYHSDQEPIAVMCPNGFAFDTRRKKCTRPAARLCRFNRMKRHVLS